MTASSIPKYILPVIVVAQFCCTSLWFAGNSVMEDLVKNYDLIANALGHLTSAVQVGFITGTLIFAILTIADRFAPSKVFLVCALLGACSNLGLLWSGNTFESLLLIRFLTGFFLAGIYPVGMKIAADYFEKGLGRSLGFLVGALVLGTAFPHLLKGIAFNFSWKSVLICTSSLAMIGGLSMLLFVPNGPFRKAGKKLNFKAFFKVFQNHKFRAAALGYFGHMWELYTFWAFVPIFFINYNNLYLTANLNVSVLSFLTIGIGGIGCVLAGYLSSIFGTKRIAFLALFLSCCCCLLSPLLLEIAYPFIFIGFLLFWGLTVVADSPLFSTLVAQNADPQIKGTALTIVNCIGFAITIFSIQLINYLQQSTNSNIIYILLAIGPILGLIALSMKSKNEIS